MKSFHVLLLPYSVFPSHYTLLLTVYFSLKRHSRGSLPHAEIQLRVESSSNPISIKGEQLQFNFGRVSPDTSDYIYQFSQRLPNTELWRCFLLCKKNEEKEGRTRVVSYSKNFTHSQRSVIRGTHHTSGQDEILS
jgi:hypothetical protein